MQETGRVKLGIDPGEAAGDARRIDRGFAGRDMGVNGRVSRCTPLRGTARQLYTAADRNPGPEDT